MPHTGVGIGAGAARAAMAAVRAIVIDSLIVAEMRDASLLYVKV